MFGIFGKKFKRTAAAANVEMRKIENKDLMEAAEEFSEDLTLPFQIEAI